MSAWPQAVLDELNAQRAIVSINADPAATAAATAAVDRLDNCAVLFSHLGQVGPWTTAPSLAEAGAALQPLVALAGREHVAVKFSGLYGVSDPAHDFPHGRPTGGRPGARRLRPEPADVGLATSPRCSIS